MRCLLLLLSLSVPLAAHAGDDDPSTVLAVQKRQYQLNHELTVGAGFLPLDAFYKSLTVNVAYTFHFNDHFSWQVARAAIARNFSTGLRRQLERDFGVLTTDFPETQWVANSNLVWSPFYGKTAFMNRAVVHLQLFLLAGASGIKDQKEIQPGVYGGLGLRFFATEHFSLRVEAGNHFVLGKRPANVIDIQAGLALNFGGAD